jgi:hypothetical protein
MPYKDPEKQKAAQKAWYEKNKELTYLRSLNSKEKRKNLVREIKESSPCKDCKMSYPYYVMHFDHINSSNKVNKVSSIIHTSSLKNILKEIKKCDLVCANCHSVRTWKRQHGLML